MKLLCKAFCLVLVMVFVFQSSTCFAGNLGYSNLNGVNRGRLIYDMGTGRLEAQPWEYRLAFLIAGYDYKNIPDMVFYIKTGKWIQLKEDMDAKVLDFGENRALRLTSIHLKKGDWVLKNGSNILMTENGNIVQRRVWEWWRTDTFREIVALVAYVAIVAAVGSILANSIGTSEAHNYIYNISGGSGGSTQLPPNGPAPSGGGPAPLPSN